jgi:hypothetical protein
VAGNSRADVLFFLLAQRRRDALAIAAEAARANNLLVERNEKI